MKGICDIWPIWVNLGLTSPRLSNLDASHYCSGCHLHQALAQALEVNSSIVDINLAFTDIGESDGFISAWREGVKAWRVLGSEAACRIMPCLCLTLPISEEALLFLSYSCLVKRALLNIWPTFLRS